MRSKLSCKEKEGIHLGWYSKACLLIHSYHKPATTQLLASWTSVLKTIKIHHHLLFVYSCWCDLLFFGTYVLSCVCASLSVLVGLCVSVFLSLSALRVNDYFLKPEHNSFRSTDRSVYRPLHIRMRAPHLEIRKAILQCLSVCHSLSVSPCVCVCVCVCVFLVCMFLFFVCVFVWVSE